MNGKKAKITRNNMYYPKTRRVYGNFEPIFPGVDPEMIKKILWPGEVAA